MLKRWPLLRYSTSAMMVLSAFRFDSASITAAVRSELVMRMDLHKGNSIEQQTINPGVKGSH